MNGNRLTKTEGSLNTAYDYQTTPAPSNRVISATSSTPGEDGKFTYDNNGNITQDSAGAPQIFSASAYTYSQRDRLSLVDNGVDAQTFYNYSGDGARTNKDFRFIFFSRQLLFNADGKLLEELNPDPVTTSRDYIWLPGTYDSVALIDSSSGTDTLYFTHNDHLGTPIAASDTGGALVWRVEPRPFGGIYSQSVTTVVNNLRFSGQYFDIESGLAQNGLRDYNEKLGRYIEPDGERVEEVGNPYAYVHNNPATRVDPEGTDDRTSAGPGSCVYYDGLCKKYADCSYYCVDAPKYCRKPEGNPCFKFKKWASDKTKSQIRKCLIEADKRRQKKQPGCPTQCALTDEHNSCFSRYGISAKCFPDWWPVGAKCK